MKIYQNPLSDRRDVINEHIQNDTESIGVHDVSTTDPRIGYQIKFSSTAHINI